MSWQLAEAPDTDNAPTCDPVELVITPHAKDLGDFEVRRALPAKQRQMVGPFIFFDQMGPTVLAPGQAVDVRPHPHIGLSTITWLFEGQIRHQDNLGFDLVIKPGEVNWMTAGRGIVHSERTPQELRDAPNPLAGIQAWVALPKDQEQIEPAFYHYAAEEFPSFNEDGVSIHLIVGSAWGKTSPVIVQSETLYAQIDLERGKDFAIPDAAEERAIYVFDGALDINGSHFDSGNMIVLKPGRVVKITASSDCRLMLLGGAPMDGPRHLFWNFVASSEELLEKAKDDWRNDRFARVPGDDERIPLPGESFE